MISSRREAYELSRAVLRSASQPHVPARRPVRCPAAAGAVRHVHLRSRRWRGSCGSRISACCAIRRRSSRRRAAARWCRSRGQKAVPAAAASASAAAPDLLRLLERRRSAHPPPRRAGGRPRRTAEGVPPLVALLGDADAEVRQMAAFALGLIGDASAREPLVAALADPSPLVKGSAAEALGLIGDPASADADRRAWLAQIVDVGALASRADEEADGDATPRRRRSGCALFALVRLKAYDAAGRRRCSTALAAARALVARGVRAAAARGSARAACAR